MFHLEAEYLLLVVHRELYLPFNPRSYPNVTSPCDPNVLYYKQHTRMNRLISWMVLLRYKAKKFSGEISERTQVLGHNEANPSVFT